MLSGFWARFVTSVERDERRPLLFGIGAAAIGVLVVLLVGTIVQTYVLTETIRENQRDSARRGKQIVAAVRIIRGCTEADGECFRDGQKRTAAAVNGVNAATLAVVAAAFSCYDDGYTDKVALTACTKARAPLS